MKTFGLIFIILFLNCSHAALNQEMSYFEFEMNGENYQILSVNAPDGGDPFNQLIGGDFIAVDYKQDQNIDKVMVGDPEKISEYLKIYKYGIQKATEKGKLKEKENINSYSNTMNMKFYNARCYSQRYCLLNYLRKLFLRLSRRAIYKYEDRRRLIWPPATITVPCLSGCGRIRIVAHTMLSLNHLQQITGPASK